MEKQLYVSSAKQLRRQVISVKNDPEAYYRQKPKGGLWTSTYRCDSHDSDWVEWCRSEEFDGVDEKTWWLLVPRPDCRIYTIDSLEDFKRCLFDYGYSFPIAHLDPIFAGKRCLDFEKLAQDFDGLHLTERGNAQTHLSYPNDLNAWDCESTLWFHWCFSEVMLVAQEKEKVS